MDGWEGEQFLIEVVLHEIAHAQDNISDGASTPWTSIHGPGNSLEHWAGEMALALRDLANREGFESIQDLIDSKETNHCQS